MSTPDFILELRRFIGTRPLWLSGVTAVITRGEGGDEVLLIRRSDNGRWTPVTGIVDPGEHPAVAAARESLEEAGVEVEVVRLASVGVTDPIVYDNGDRSQYLDLTFRCRWVSGEAYPADGEASEVGWFRRESMPEMSNHMLARLDAALSDELPARFVSG